MRLLKKERENTLKARCKKFYDECEWEKVSFHYFYQRVSRNPDRPRTSLLLAQEPKPYKFKKYKYTWKHIELWERYSNQENPPVKFNTFVARVKDGKYSKEEAILWWDGRKAIMEERAKNRVIVPKVYIPKRIKPEEEKQNDDDFFIKITYPKEVANVFLREYENLLEDLEYKLTDVLDKESRNKIEADILRIKTEIMVFKCYNDM